MSLPARHVLRTVRHRFPILVRNALLPSPETEALSSCEPHLLKWYTCGPTVYDDAHIGHARAYITFDIMRRLLSRHTGIAIDYALGVTDVDDKILARSAERNIPVIELARRFETRFFEDLSALNVLPPTHVLRVTEFIPDIQELVERLERKGAAYAAPSGSVYFSVSSRGPRYAQLDRSRGLADDSHVGENAAEHLNEKRDARDFALWKGGKSATTWPSPWGPGRPGWHVECSAMAQAALGNYLDVHAGGIDLRFPHHTNELATAEAGLSLPTTDCRPTPSSERWANVWFHAGHLHQAGRKMSKSLKNFVSIRDYLAQGDEDAADVFRIFCLETPYAAPAEFTPDRATQARATLVRLVAAARTPYASPDARRVAVENGAVTAELRGIYERVEKAVADDVDLPGVLTAARQAADIALMAPALARAEAGRLVNDVLDSVGIVSGSSKSDQRAEDKIIDAAVALRGHVRTAARKKDVNGVLQACDQAREELAEMGVRIADAKDGSSTWSRG